MATGVLLSPELGLGRASGRPRPDLVRVARRGPLLRASASAPGVFGLDLTAGCSHACPFCFLRGTARDPGPDRVLFDPEVADRLAEVLGGLAESPRLVVLSPTSDPLPAFDEVRAATAEALHTLADRKIPALLMTRGRIDADLVDLLAWRRDQVRVAVGLMTRDPVLARRLEPGAALPRARLRAIGRLIAAGVDVEARLEPLIPGLTDTRANVVPLFEALAATGVRKVLAHYLFHQPAPGQALREALAPLGWAERVGDLFDGGPVFRVGSHGVAKHLPLDVRRGGLAQLAAWGAEFGLRVETGAAQNPDFPRPLPVNAPTPAPARPGSRAGRGPAPG